MKIDLENYKDKYTIRTIKDFEKTCRNIMDDNEVRQVSDKAISTIDNLIKLSYKNINDNDKSYLIATFTLLTALLTDRIDEYQEHDFMDIIKELMED